METVTIALAADVKTRLEALAQKMGRSTDDCLQLAVQEFVENWEIHLNDLYQIDEHEARAVLNAPQD